MLIFEQEELNREKELDVGQVNLNVSRLKAITLSRSVLEKTTLFLIFI